MLRGWPAHAHIALIWLYRTSVHITRSYHQGWKECCGSVEPWYFGHLRSERNKRIGRRKRIRSGRYNIGDIETSKGNSFNRKLEFDNKKVQPHRWHIHPSIPGSTICGSDPIKTKRYSCFALGLETGKTSGSYLGLTWVMAVKLLDFHPVMPTSMYWSLPAVMVMMRGYRTLEATFPSPPPMSGCEPHLALQQFCATPMESPLYLLADAKPTPTSQWCRSKYGDAYPHSGRSGR